MKKFNIIHFINKFDLKMGNCNNNSKDINFDDALSNIIK